MCYPEGTEQELQASPPFLLHMRANQQDFDDLDSVAMLVWKFKLVNLIISVLHLLFPNPLIFIQHDVVIKSFQ